MTEFQRGPKPLETLASVCALERLNGSYLRLAVQLMRAWRTAPENLVVEYAETWDSYKFAIYGFRGNAISLMLNFNNLESLMQFVQAASAWGAKWILHESMNFAPVASTEKNNMENQDVVSVPRKCKLRCFMCDEELKLPNEHLLAVTCDRFNTEMPLWTHC